MASAAVDSAPFDSAVVTSHLAAEAEPTVEGESPQVLEIQARLADEGRVEVTETFTWNPTKNPTHITRTLPLFVQYSAQSWRQFEYTNFRVESDNVDLTMKVKDDSHKLAVDISPAQDSTFSIGLPELGTKDSDEAESLTTVTLSYTVGGALASFSGPQAQNNEFFWAPLVSGGYAFDQVEFTLHSSRSANKVSCELLTENDPLLSVEESDSPTPAEESAQESAVCEPQLGATPQVQASNMTLASGLALRYEFPSGTFDTSSAIYVSQPQLETGSNEGEGQHGEDFDPTWSENIDFGLEAGGNLLLPVTAGAVALVFGTLLWALTRKRPDWRFAHLANGEITGAQAATAALVAAAGSSKRAALRKASRKNPTGVEKTVKVAKHLPAHSEPTPPTDLSVGEIGALWSCELRWVDAMSTLVSLAIRGKLSLRYSANIHEWVLTPSHSSQSGELGNYEAALLGSIFPDNQSVYLSTIHSRFAPQVLEALSVLGQELRTRNLVTSHLDHEASRKANRQQRTPLGRAYAEHIAGFRSHLALACESNLELQGEPIDLALFEKYLPVAMSLGLEREWARAFDQQGVRFVQPAWCSILPAVQSPQDPTKLGYTQFLTRLESLLH